MGSKDDIMQHFIENGLKRQFPECLGWKIISREFLSGYDQIITFERLGIRGEERIIVGFTFDPALSDLILMKLNNVPASSPANSRSNRKAILVAKGCDLSGLPMKTEVYYLKNFVYRDSELVWLKHPNERFQRMEKPEVKSETPVSVVA